MKKAFPFVAAAIVLLLGGCWYFLTVRSSDAPIKNLFQPKGNLLALPDGETPEFYAERVGELTFVVTTAWMGCVSPETPGATKVAARQTILKSVKPMRNAIKKLATSIDNSSSSDTSSAETAPPDSTPPSTVELGFTSLLLALEGINAHEEIVALEPFARELLDSEYQLDNANGQLIYVYKKILFEIGVKSAITESQAIKEGKAKTLRKLLDAERGKSERDEVRVEYLEKELLQRIALDVKEKPSEEEAILQAAIDEEKASANPSEDLLDQWRKRLRSAIGERFRKNGDAEGALKYAREKIDASFENPTSDIVQDVASALGTVHILDSKKGDEIIVETIDRYLGSGVDALVEGASNLGGMRKFDGEKPLVEGVCVDGSVLDWDAYRGKPTLLFIGDAEDLNDQGVDECFELLKRFAGNENVNVLGYTLDDDLDRWKPFEDATPWNSVSKKLSLDSQDKKYRELTTYYGFKSVRSGPFGTNRDIPRLIAFDSSGVVVRNMRIDFLSIETYLSEICPDFFETAYRPLFELFDVPTGENAAFYKERLNALSEEQNTISKLYDRHKDSPIKERFDVLEQKRREAVAQTVKMFAFLPDDDKSLDEEEIRRIAGNYVIKVESLGNVAALEELLEFERAKEKPDQNRVFDLEYDLLEAKITQANADPEHAVDNLRQLLDAELAGAQENKDGYPHNALVHLKRVLFEREARAALDQNDEPALKEILDRLLEDSVRYDPDSQSFVGVEGFLESAIRTLNNELQRPDLAEYLRNAAIERLKATDSESAERPVSRLEAIEL